MYGFVEERVDSVRAGPVLQQRRAHLEPNAREFAGRWVLGQLAYSSTPTGYELDGFAAHDEHE